MVKNLKMIRTRGMIKRELDIKQMLKNMGIKERNIFFELDVENGLNKIGELISQLSDSQQKYITNMFKDLNMGPIMEDDRRKSITLDRYKINFQIENYKKLPEINLKKRTDTNSHTSNSFKSEESRSSKKSISSREIFKELENSTSLKMLNFENLSNIEKVGTIAKYNKY